MENTHVSDINHHDWSSKYIDDKIKPHMLELKGMHAVIIESRIGA